ncbi:MAG: BMP family ABC transporter substrate-binding protein [Armatimonadaceae bacterium]
MNGIFRRQFLFASLCSLVALALTGGCAQQEEPAPSATPAAANTETGASTFTAPEGPLKVALITPAKVSDKGWGQSAYEGIQLIQKDLGAETLQPVEEPPLAQVESAMRDAAQQGAVIVYGHGSEYDDAAKKIAAESPKTVFVVMGGKSAGPNLMPIQFASGEATYLAGMLAAAMSKTGKIGLVGGDEIPIIKQAFDAFAAGAKSVKPDIEVKTTFTGNGTDVAKAKQQAQALLDAGADVLMHNANAAGAGVFQAVMERDGAMVIGANADQSDQATPKNLGSFILDVPAAMVAVAKRVKEGNVTGEAYSAGIKDKAVGFKFNPQFAGTIPQEIKDKMQAAEQAMAEGKLNPNS